MMYKVHTRKEHKEIFDWLYISLYEGIGNPTGVNRQDIIIEEHGIFSIMLHILVPMYRGTFYMEGVMPIQWIK